MILRAFPIWKPDAYSSQRTRAVYSDLRPCGLLASDIKVYFISFFTGTFGRHLNSMRKRCFPNSKQSMFVSSRIFHPTSASWLRFRFWKAVAFRAIIQHWSTKPQIFSMIFVDLELYFLLLFAEVTLRVLPLQVQQLGWSFPSESQLQQGMLCQVSSQQNHPVVSSVNSSWQRVQDMVRMTSCSKRIKADTHCLVALCASSATVLLTLHPSASVLLSEIYFCLAPAAVYWKRAFDHFWSLIMIMPLILQVVQKIQYNAKDVSKQHQVGCPKLVFIEWPTDQASWVPDATWLRMEPQARSWQLELIQGGEMKFASRMQFNAVYIPLHIDLWRFSMMRDAALVSVSFQDWVHSTQAPKSHAVFTVVQCAKSWHLLSTAGWCRRSSALRCLWPNSSHHACLPWIIFFLLLRAGGLVAAGFEHPADLKCDMKWLRSHLWYERSKGQGGVQSLLSRPFRSSCHCM